MDSRQNTWATEHQAPHIPTVGKLLCQNLWVPWGMSCLYGIGLLPSAEPDIIAYLTRLLGTFKDATWDFYLKSESL